MILRILMGYNFNWEDNIKIDVRKRDRMGVVRTGLIWLRIGTSG
jgi:hypothetical protein